MKSKIFLFFFLIYIFTSGGHLYSVDGEKLFLVTRAMVEENSFQMEDGRFSPYGLGPSFFAIPFYLLGKGIACLVKVIEPIEVIRGVYSTFNSFITALTCVILFNILRAFSISTRACFLTTLLYGIGSLAWPYSKYCFPQPLIGFFLLGGISGLIQFSLKKGPVWCQNASLCTGLLIFTRYEGILFFLLGLGYLSLKKEKRLQNLISFSIFPFIFIIFSMLYNYIRTGAYLNPGYGTTFADYSTPLLLGLYGNLFSFGKGLLIYMPVILLFPIGLRFFSRHQGDAGFRYRREAVFISITFLVYLIFYSKWWDWSGDWAWGPRLLVGILPLSFIPIGFLLERITLKSIAGILVFTLSLLSISLQILALPISFNEYLRDVYRNPEVKVDFMNHVVKVRPHHFIPEQSPLKVHLRLIKERVEALRKGEKLLGYDYHGRKVQLISFDFWYINLWGKAPFLKKPILGFLILILLIWGLILHKMKSLTIVIMSYIINLNEVHF